MSFLISQHTHRQMLFLQTWRQCLLKCPVHCLQYAYLALLSGTAFIHPSKSDQQGANLFLLEIFFTALVAIFAGFGKVSGPV